MIQYQGTRPDEGLDVEFYDGSTLDDKAMEAAYFAKAALDAKAAGNDEKEAVAAARKEWNERIGQPTDITDPVFKSVPFVRIKIPGNRDEILDVKAWIDEKDANKVNAHNRRFPFAWQRYKEKLKAGPQGFPLTEWAALLRAQVDTLAWHNVRTIEQLADISDADTQKVPQGLELRTKARKWLEQKNSAESMREEMLRMRAELDALKRPPAPNLTVIPPSATEAIETMLTPGALEQKLADMAEAQAARESAARRRRGRPPKAIPTPAP